MIYLCSGIQISSLIAKRLNRSSWTLAQDNSPFQSLGLISKDESLSEQIGYNNEYSNGYKRVNGNDTWIDFCGWFDTSFNTFIIYISEGNLHDSEASFTRFAAVQIFYFCNFKCGDTMKWNYKPKKRGTISDGLFDST